MMSFPEQEQNQNAQDSRESGIGSGKPGLISDKAQSRLADRAITVFISEFIEMIVALTSSDTSF